jgi:hypothetical protein
MIDPKEFNFVSQISHFVGGMCVVFGTACLIPGYAYLFFASLWVVYAGIKEFWYDYHYESTEVRGSSLEDFLYQVGGAGLAILLLLAFR